MSDAHSSQSSRYRSIPYRPPYYVAVFWTLLHLCSIAAFITCVVLFFMNLESENRGQLKLLIIATSASAVLSLIVSNYKRRAARCPLCIGTPLMNCGALPHKRSKKITPFNEGFTAVLSIALTQKFRCMYCGTRYDLLKTSRKRKQSEHESDV
ncbi:MAG: hypothetical protein RI957_2009 [Verrucomicrobiota bacterium]|jgi:DNA-directed RNA polymerase subunit RPC12/RpoP